jgi:hypothetical protein
MKRRTALLVILGLSLAVGGIAFAIRQFDVFGGKPVHIHGTITRDGKPLQWKTDNRQFIVVFHPEPSEIVSDIYPATTDADTGTYDISEIPTGTYKIQIQQNDPDHRSDLLKMVYDPYSSTIIRKVTHDGQVIDIDLPKDLPPRRALPPPRQSGADRQPPSTSASKGGPARTTK